MLLHAAGQQFPDGTSICQGQFENNQPIEGTLTKLDGTSRYVEYAKHSKNNVFKDDKPKPKGTGSARKKEKDPVMPGPEVASPDSSASLEGPQDPLERGASKRRASRAVSPAKKAKHGGSLSSVDPAVEEKLEQLKSWHEEGLLPKQAWSDVAAELLKAWARGEPVKP